MAFFRNRRRPHPLSSNRRYLVPSRQEQLDAAYEDSRRRELGLQAAGEAELAANPGQPLLWHGSIPHVLSLGGHGELLWRRLGQTESTSYAFGVTGFREWRRRFRLVNLTPELRRAAAAQLRQHTRHALRRLHEKQLAATLERDAREHDRFRAAD